MINEGTQRKVNPKIRRIERFQIKDQIVKVPSPDFAEALLMTYDKYLSWVNQDKTIFRETDL
jgi:hypothetical protein